MSPAELEQVLAGYEHPARAINGETKPPYALKNEGGGGQWSEIKHK